MARSIETAGRGPRIKAALAESVTDAALALLIAVVALRVALAAVTRGVAPIDDLWSWEAFSGFGAFAAATAGLGLWGIVIAPVLAGLTMRPLRRARLAWRIPLMVLVTAVNAVLPLVVLGAMLTLFQDAQTVFRDAALIVAVVAVVGPTIVLIAGFYLARQRAARLVIDVLSLVALIELAYHFRGY